MFFSFAQSFAQPGKFWQNLALIKKEIHYKVPPFTLLWVNARFNYY